MPWLFLFFIIFTLVATVFVVGRRNLPADDEGRRVATGVILVCGVLARLTAVVGRWWR